MPDWGKILQEIAVAVAEANARSQTRRYQDRAQPLTRTVVYFGVAEGRLDQTMSSVMTIGLTSRTGSPTSAPAAGGRRTSSTTFASNAPISLLVARSRGPHPASVGTRRSIPPRGRRATPPPNNFSCTS